ncbi:22701_t:CDS:2, partial [Dentiscutata erythropus]
ARYNFPLATIKKWLESQKMHQIYRSSPKNTPYASYSRISKPNCVHQCDLIEILYDEDNRYKDFVFLISKSSSEVANAFRNIYENPNNYLIYPRLLQCDEGREFMGSVTLLIVDCYAGLFTLRVFKNQYVIEFLLPTGKCCREYERFARRIVGTGR